MKYIFIHIGKTAGTSFRTFLESNVSRPYFGYNKLWYLTDVRDTQKFLELEPNGMTALEYCDLFSEHMSYGLHPYLKTKDYQYVAMFREPLSRTLSAYRYAIDRGWITEEDDVIDWFHNDESQKHYQMHHIAGVPHDLPYETKFQIALKNLKDDKLLFGFTEKYDEFIDLCCEINKWRPQYRTTNKTSSKKEVSEENKEKLKELLAEEIEFYNEALKIYNEKYKSFIKND
jgi:hypothetical protein